MTLGYLTRAVAFRFRLDCMLGTLPSDIGAVDSSDTKSEPLRAVLRSCAKLIGGSAKRQRKDRMFAAYVERCQEEAGTTEGLDAELSPAVRELMMRQTSALFGNVNRMHLEFQDSFGDALQAASGDGAAAEVAARVRADLEGQRLECSTLRVARLRHLVREAAALGALLRDAEAYVRSYGVLL